MLSGSWCRLRGPSHSDRANGAPYWSSATSAAEVENANRHRRTTHGACNKRPRRSAYHGTSNSGVRAKKTGHKQMVLRSYCPRISERRWMAPAPEIGRCSMTCTRFARTHKMRGRAIHIVLLSLVFTELREILDQVSMAQRHFQVFQQLCRREEHRRRARGATCRTRDAVGAKPWV